MVEYIESLFINLKNEKSDINEHLETLKKLSSECDTVIELGIRWMVSIIALAVSGCKNIYGYDVIHPSAFDGNRFENLEKYCKKYNLNLNIVQGDVLELTTIPECDLLFIDTFHAYRQLKSELFLFSDKVKKYIVMHDTNSYAEIDEAYISKKEWFEKYKNNEIINEIVDINCEKQGLKNAIEDFLSENKDWEIFKIYENNNGLTVLKRKN